MREFCFEILSPILIIIGTISIIILFINLILLGISEMKKNNKKRNNNYVCNEPKAYEYKVQRAIIVLGDEKLEIEVDDYDICDNIVEIESIDGRVFITDIKNVLLMSE